MGLCFGKEAADADAHSSTAAAPRHKAANGQLSPPTPASALPADVQRAASSQPTTPEDGEVIHNLHMDVASHPPATADATTAAAPQPPAPPPPPPPEPTLQTAPPDPQPLLPPPATPSPNGNHAPSHPPAPHMAPLPHPPSAHTSPNSHPLPRTPPADSAAPAPADQPLPATPSPSFMSSLFVNRRARDPSKPPSTCRLLGLPEPLLIHLLSLIDLPDATLLSCTCLLLHRLVSDNSLWQAQILQRLHSAAGRMPIANGASAPSHPPASPSPASPTDLYIPYTAPQPPQNGFMRHRAPRRPTQHAPGERWDDAAAALLPSGCQHYSHEQLLRGWQQVAAAAGPLQHLQGLYHYLDTGATCTRPLLRRSAGLQATFALVLPGHYEVVWYLKFKHAKVTQAGHMRFDTCVTYHHLHGEPASPAEYGNKSTVWNGAQLSALEHKHGRGNWAAVVVTALKVDRLCQTEVAVKGMDECHGIWVRRVQLRRVVPAEQA